VELKMTETFKASRDARPDSCLHCVLMTALEEWFERHGKREANGDVVIDVLHAINKLCECTVELAEETPQSRSDRRRALRFAHEALDAHVKSVRTGKLVPVTVPSEH
jgi:hypothetical protein